MPAWSTETLLAAALVALFSIFNLIVRKLRERAQAAQEQVVVAAPPVAPVPGVLNDYEWGGATASMANEAALEALPVVAPVGPSVETAAIRPSSQTSAVSRVRADLRSPRSVQEAVVLMAILGPCRADDPGAGMPDSARGSGGRPAA